MTHSSKPTVAALAALVSLTSGCASISSSETRATRNLDPISADPADIVFAVGVPEGLRLQSGDAILELAYQADGADPDRTLRETAVLQIKERGNGAPEAHGAKEHVYLARIASSDMRDIAQLQDTVRGLRARGIEGTGSLTVQIVGGCYVGDAPDSLALSTWLQTDPDRGFVTLNKRQDLTAAIGEQAATALEDKLEPCAALE